MAVAMARRVHWTEEEYTDFENHSAEKHEFLGGEIFAMAGARPAHNLLVTECSGSLNNLCRRSERCRAFDSNQRIHIPATGLYTYPDGGVVCGPMSIHKDGMSLLNPLLLFEVLSPSTRDYDLGAKREHYLHIPSLRHLLLIDQPEQVVSHYWRTGTEWQSREIREGALELPELNGAVLLGELYRPEPLA